MINDKLEVYILGKQIGFGNMMHLASACWKQFLVEENWPAGGEIVIGPCKGMTVDCVCVDNNGSPGNCEYCCGCGWLTEKVKKILEKK